MVRCFFAIDLPAGLREEIGRLQARLRETGADVRWVRPESVHLTLKFLGDVAEDKIKPLAEAAAEAASARPGLYLNLDRSGVFPNRKKARVVWLGLKGDLDLLADLQKGIEAAAEAFGFAPEKRSFKPHLTLGRVRSGRGRSELLTALETLEPRPLGFEAGELILFKSDLRPSGAVYTALHRLKLKDKNIDQENGKRTGRRP